MQKKRLSPVQTITLSFAAVMLVGAILLTLPLASRSGESVSFIDALFISASASCVTGLSVFETVAQWSLFGQLVILVLVQIGGIGIITLAMYLLSLLHAKIGMRNRFALQESIGAETSAGVVKMTRFIAGGMVFFELFGALLLMPVFIRDFGVAKGIYYSVFHSVSAFCNAGFDLLGAESLSPYSANLYVNIVIMALIVIGGLGFFVWLDLVKNKLRFGKMTLHTKIVIVTTAVLLIFGALFIFILSYGSKAFEGKTLFEKILASCFQSVTARTAGFYTADLNALGGAAQAFMIVLMLIGGASGSTAGGIKVTTVAVILLLVRSIFVGKEDIEVYGRRIERRIVRTAIVIFVIYLGLALASGIAISAIEGADITASMFESFSAIATVGLSLSLTPTLSAASKVIIILLMFIGRVGGLTILFSLSGKKDASVGRYPAENVTVG